MIPVSTLSDNTFQKARRLWPPVKRLDLYVYEVRCLSNHRHLVRFMWFCQRLLAVCDKRLCPARAGCYHIAAALDEYEFDLLMPGHRVLVHEREGFVWHTFIQTADGLVFTFEEPDGFPRPFVLDYYRSLTQGRYTAT